MENFGTLTEEAEGRPIEPMPESRSYEPARVPARARIGMRQVTTERLQQQQEQHAEAAAAAGAARGGSGCSSSAAAYRARESASSSSSA